MLVGAGARARSCGGARRWRRPSASPIVKTLSGKAVVPDDHPLTTGGIGLLGTAPSEEAMENCDTLLMVGTNFPYTKFLPEAGQAKVVQIEADPVRAGNRLPTEVPWSATPRRRSPPSPRFLVRHQERGFLETPRQECGRGQKRWTPWPTSSADPVQPQHLMKVIDRLAADDAILTCDSGTIATWAARHFTVRGKA